MSEPTPNTDQVHETVPQIYDPAARNRFEFKITENGSKYEIAHIFGELTDERYLQWIKEFNVSGSEDDVDETSREATCRLWDDVIDHLDGVDFEDGDWKSFVPYRQKIEAINQFVAVAIFEDDAEPAAKKPRFGPQSGSLKVITEAWANGEIVQQHHEMRAVTVELEKKYARIQGRRFKQEQVKGFRKKQKITYIPQDEKLAELYDEMLVNVSGFANSFDNKPTIPTRFKTTVIHEIFASPVEAKK
jgi:hypothetical protein